MQFAPRTVALHSGHFCMLRSAACTDADAMLAHLKATAAETENLSRYPDEIMTTTQEEAQFLTQTLEDPRGIMLMAFVDGELAGTASFHSVAKCERMRHRAECGLSVRKAFWGMGVGRALLSAIVETARQAGCQQLELEVVATNTRAIKLYEKMGFLQYGIRQRALRYRDGSYAAELLMLLWL